jgi:predicted esterase
MAGAIMQTRIPRALVALLLAGCGADSADPVETGLVAEATGTDSGTSDEGQGSSDTSSDPDATAGDVGEESVGSDTHDDGVGETADPDATDGGETADCGPSRGAGGPTGENEMSFGNYPTAWMYAPPGKTDPLPLVVSLHGSGDDPYNFNYQFLGAAETDGFLLVTPGPSNPMGWNTMNDEEIIFAAIEAMKARHDVDTCRIYVAGFSAGAYYSFVLGLQHSEVFAAFGSIQGSIVYAEGLGIWPGMVTRKIPASIHVGTLDGAFMDAQRSRDVLEAAGHTVYFRALQGVGHQTTQQIAAGVWQDMKNHSLQD